MIMAEEKAHLVWDSASILGLLDFSMDFDTIDHGILPDDLRGVAV